MPPNPADDRGRIVFDVHGTHHQVPDSSNDDRAVEAHRQRSCTCYRDAAPHPAPAPSPEPAAGPGPGPGHRTVGPLTPMHRYTFSSLPTSLRFSLTAATAEEAQAQAARLEHETHDLASSASSAYGSKTSPSATTAIPRGPRRTSTAAPTPRTRRARAAVARLAPPPATFIPAARRGR